MKNDAFKLKYDVKLNIFLQSWGPYYSRGLMKRLIHHIRYALTVQWICSIVLITHISSSFSSKPIQIMDWCSPLWQGALHGFPLMANKKWKFSGQCCLLVGIFYKSRIIAFSHFWALRNILYTMPLTEQLEFSTSLVNRSSSKVISITHPKTRLIGILLWYVSFVQYCIRGWFVDCGMNRQSCMTGSGYQSTPTASDHERPMIHPATNESPQYLHKL